MRDADLFDCVCMPLFVDDHALWIAVFCGERKDCFDADDIEIARYLAAHLGRAASLAVKLAGERNAATESEAGPLIVVEDAKFVAANAAAGSALFASGLARAESGRVLFSGPDISRRLEQFLAEDAARQTRAALCSLDVGDGAVVSIFRPPTISGPRSGRAEYLLMFDRDTAGVRRAERCAQALSISERDAELAILFAEGLAPEDVARACGGAASDYRARMLHLYAELGVRDQGALVLRVLAATRAVGIQQAD